MEYALLLLQVWTWQAGGFVFAPLIIIPISSQNDRGQFQILVSCYDFSLYSLSINEESKVSVLWKTRLGGRLGSAAFPFNIRTSSGIDNICAAICSSIGELYIVNLQDGEIHGCYNVKSEVFSSPVVHKDRIYFGSRDNNMYNLRMQF